MMHRFFTWIWEVIATTGVDLSILPPLTTATTVLIIAIVLGGIYRLLIGPVARVINIFVDKTETQADDILLSPKIVRAICMMIVVMLASYCLPRITICYPSMRHPFEIAARVMNIFAITRVLLLEATALCVFLRHGDNRKSGILVLRNILTTVILGVSALLIISTLMDRDLAYVISALGAMAAVLMLVFKDSILGMLAGIRLTINGMLRENDWVTVPAFNADGRVEDVSLTAVKIRNWDKSVSTIPPYSLITGGFVNHESMLSLGIRQIRRSILIDTSSIRRLKPGELDNNMLQPSQTTLNITLFRHHIRQLLSEHPRRAHTREKHPLQLHVRELAPTPEGLPIEIFMFVECTDWEEFEQLQGDIMDEIMASVADFRLRIYQKPAGTDFSHLETHYTGTEVPAKPMRNKQHV